VTARRAQQAEARSTASGIFGALVAWQRAASFGEYLPSILQGIFSPAFMVYKVFEALAN
jgi:hypothetical protein